MGSKGGKRPASGAGQNGQEGCGHFKKLIKAFPAPFIAGLYDAEGSRKGSEFVAVHNTDEEIIEAARGALRRLKIKHIVWRQRMEPTLTIRGKTYKRRKTTMFIIYVLAESRKSSLKECCHSFRYLGRKAYP